ncbi:MAG: M20/M25/M40 family metallo-hydrolase [Bacteroidota bacterium]
MNKFKTLVPAILGLWLLTSPVFAQEIKVKTLKDDIYMLASDSFRGRKSGTLESRLCANWMVSRFQNIGIKEFNDYYFQEFNVVYEVKLGPRCAMSFPGYVGKAGIDFTPLSFSDNAVMERDVAFVGYGFTIKQDSLKWDDYAGIDVTNKWVLVMRGNPEYDKSTSKFVSFSDERGKVLNAKDHGAAGVIIVTGKDVDKNDTLLPLFFDKSASTAGVPVVNIRRSVAELLLKASGKSLEELEKTFKKDMKPASFPISTVVKATTQVSMLNGLTQNIMGYIPGSDPKLKDEYIVIGAHYDHLGMGGPESGSRRPDTLAIHNGADDNASGVGGILALAEYFAKNPNKPKRSIIIVAFSGEEMGLLGSKYFVGHCPVDLKKVKAMFNFDMIGRLPADSASLMISGTGTSVEAEDLLNKYGKNQPFKIKFSTEGYGASDHSSFYMENIPVFFFTTGAHDDYHTPADKANKINYEGEKEVLDYAKLVVEDVVNRDQVLSFREAGPKGSAGRGGYRFKVTLGILPDFTSSNDKGLRVDGVTKDRPAAKGGMLKGDIITALNGKPVKNIYEYMDRMKTLEAGQTVNIDIIRGDKRMVLLIQL